MKFVVGLGNPGTRYKQTRHNLGFLVADEFCRRRSWTWSRRECKARTAAGRYGHQKIKVAKPSTYMNLSGAAVAALLDKYHAGPGDLLVVCDDMALPLGVLRIRGSGSDGGHKGLRDISERLKSRDFARLRIGILTHRGLGEDLSDYVLRRLEPKEWELASEQVLRATDCVEFYLEHGIQAAMSRFNRRHLETIKSSKPVQSSNRNSEG